MATLLNWLSVAFAVYERINLLKYAFREGPGYRVCPAGVFAAARHAGSALPTRMEPA